MEVAALTRRRMICLGLTGSVAAAWLRGRAAAHARPDAASDRREDLAIDDATALLYPRQAPLIPAAGLKDARAVWSHIPGQPDRGVLVYLHGHNGYVTVDAGGKPRVPDWAAGDDAARKGASGKPPAPLVYGLDRLDEKPTGKHPIVLVPEVSTLATGSFWAREPAGQYADPDRLGRLVADCLDHLADLRRHDGRGYLPAGFGVRPDAADRPALDRVYLCGHSGAGLPMEEAAVSRLILPGGGVPADLWLFDCTYWSRVDGFLRFCARWKAEGRLAGGRRDASRFVCVYRPRTQTEKVADALRAEVARAIDAEPSTLVVDHTPENLETDVRPALGRAGAIFVRTHLRTTRSPPRSSPSYSAPRPRHRDPTCFLAHPEGSAMRRLALAVLSFCGLMVAAGRGEAAPGRPNVVLIIADDMAREDCGAYGNAAVRTPNIDRLAREGMRFDRAFVTASSCSPSRSSILTGRYPHNTGADELHWPLPGDRISFVERLKAAGYWTAAAGKWHLGDAVKDRFDLVREADPSGFQLGAGQDGGSRMSAKGAGEAKSGCDRWVPVLRERPRDRPFFLWLASLDPHRDYEPGAINPPHRPADAVVPPYLPDVPEVRADLAQYYDEIGRLDRFVGEVLAELDRQGVADETVVLFLSDNGRPFPRCKTTLYDSGIATPLLVRWPGHVRPGGRCEGLVSTIDIAPTVLKLAGLPPGATFQGKDFSPMLADPSARVRDLVFAERNWHDYAAHGRAARSERFKYIRNDDTARPLTPPADAVRSPTFRAMQRLNAGGKLPPAQLACFASPRPAEELYDVEADPHELVNLAGDPKLAGELGRLRSALASWGRATSDATPDAFRLTPDEFDRETGEPLPNRVRPRRPPAPARGDAAP